MARKGTKDAAAELEPAQDVQDAAGAGAAVDAGVAGAGQAGEAEAGAAAAGDEIAAGAAAAGEVPGAADADADAADGAQPETAAEAGDTDGFRHEPAAYDEFAGIVAVEFGETALTVKLADGQAFLVSYSAIDFLDSASDEALRDIDIEPHRLVWPAFERVITVDRLAALAAAGYDWRQQDADDGETAPAAPGNRMDINVLAAYAAASLAFGMTEEDVTTLPRIDGAWLGQLGTRAQAAALCAAGFLRRDAAVLVQPETLVIHLKRSGFPDAAAAEGRAAVAWKVFAFTLAELDALDRTRAEAARRAEAAAAASGPRPARRLSLAMQRADANPLTELGRQLQGRS